MIPAGYEVHIKHGRGRRPPNVTAPKNRATPTFNVTGDGILWANRATIGLLGSERAYIAPEFTNPSILRISPAGPGAGRYIRTGATIRPLYAALGYRVLPRYHIPVETEPNGHGGISLVIRVSVDPIGSEPMIEPTLHATICPSCRRRDRVAVVTDPETGIPGRACLSCGTLLD